MGQRWGRIGAIAPVHRVSLALGGDPWHGLAVPAPRVAPVRIAVSRVALRAQYAPSPDEVAAWPLLADGGVVTEFRSRA